MLRIVILGIITSTIAATVVATTQQVLETKESCPRLILSWSISLPSSTVTSVVASKPKESGVSLAIISLTSSSASTRVTSSSIESSSQHSAAHQTSSQSQDSSINKLVASA